jgi:hypothetical protein
MRSRGLPQLDQIPSEKRTIKWAPVAQLDTASAFEAEGREFESLRARHLLLPIFVTLNAFVSYCFWVTSCSDMEEAMNRPPGVRCGL